MAAKTVVSDVQLADALRKGGGIKSIAARACHITRQAVQSRVERTPLLQLAIRDAKQQLLDIAESTVVRGVKRSDKYWTRLYLTHQGKERGYGNTVGLELDDAQAEAIVASLGGDIQKFRTLLASLGVAPSEIP